MPAHNEQEYLAPAVEHVVGGLRGAGTDFEVIVCQNGSTDATSAIAHRLAAAHPEVVALDLDRADYGAALRHGFLRASGQVVVNFDVDLVDLDFLYAARHRMDATGAVIVVGSKRTEGADDRRPAGRRLVTAVFSAVLRRGFGLRVSDTHGLKLLARQHLGALVGRCRFGDDIFDTELILRAERAGLLVEEIPVQVVDQRPPRTPIVRRIPRSLLGLARLRRALWQERRWPAPVAVSGGDGAESGGTPPGAAGHDRPAPAGAAAGQARPTRRSTRRLPRPAASSSEKVPDSRAAR
jgi:glycosyltransferase involved in cell wall biosynthesis